jgi:hypothetical protein
MLQVFYLDVAKVDLDIAYVTMAFKCLQMFLQRFQTYIASVSAIFGCMLQVFHLDVAKVDQVFHMLQ